MASQDDVWAALILGGLVGAALAKKPEEKKEQRAYPSLEQQALLRQQKIGNFPSLENVKSKPEVYNIFVESARMFSFGFFRGSSILASALIESVLREKFGEMRFADLIEKSKTDGLVLEPDYHYLHALRSQRNDFVHNVFVEVKEEDALLMLQITVRLLNKIL